MFHRFSFDNNQQIRQFMESNRIDIYHCFIYIPEKEITNKIQSNITTHVKFSGAKIILP